MTDQVVLVAREVRQRDDEEADGCHAGGEGHEQRPLLDPADERQKDDEEDLADLISGIDPARSQPWIKTDSF